MQKVKHLEDAPVVRRGSRIIDFFMKAKSRGYTEDGQQVVDGTPMAPPVGYKRQPSMVEIVREQIRSHKLAEEALAARMGTFEEEDDFEDPDDPNDHSTPYENDFDPPIKELTSAGQEVIQEREKAAALAQGGPGSQGGQSASAAPPPPAPPKSTPEAS